MAWLKLLRFPKSLRWRYSLRALLIFITLFMIWGGYHTNRSWKERAAEEVLRRNGATVDYRNAHSDGDVWSQLASAYQTVVQTLWRERYVNSVRINSELAPELVGALSALPHLETLVVQPEQVVGEEFIRRQMQCDFEPRVRVPEGVLSRILADKSLKSLSLCVWVLSDEDCAAIAQHRTLEEIDIFGCEVSEEGFAQIITKPGLRTISFSFCRVKGEKLAGLPGSKSLEAIGCEASPAGNKLAAFLGRSQNLRQVMCRSWSADDDFVAAIGAHPKLKRADFPGATDRSIEAFVAMPQLELLILADGSVSEAGLNRLGAARPNLEVRVHPFPNYWTKERSSQ